MSETPRTAGRTAEPGRIIYHHRAKDSRLGATLFACFVAAIIAGILIINADSESPAASADAFARAWSQGDDAAAAAKTSSPEKAADALTASRNGLDGAEVAVQVVDVVEEGDRASARLSVEWDVAGIGPFNYETRLRLERAEDDWQVDWKPNVVHPDLKKASYRLGTVRESAPRGEIIDRNGKAIVRARPVVDVGVEAAKVRDVESTVDAFAGLLDIDRRAFSQAIRGAGPLQFVSAITLRKDDFESLESSLDSIPGATFVAREQQLAPSREFARAALGAVSPVTAEQLEELGPDYATGDQVGQSGLEAAFEGRLSGVPTRKVVVRIGDAPTNTLKTVEGRDGKALRTTLDTDVQTAAENALGQVNGKAALVAVEPSTGDVLAVANRPTDSTFNRAFEGQYPPGSTFKIVTTTALLRAGEVSPDATVDCPQFATVGGVQFKNFETSELGAVPFSEIFAQSCNTGFVSLADRLDANALKDAGDDFGLGEDSTLPVPTFGGDVPRTPDLEARAAAMIGQDRNLVSPLAMAGVAATVAEGRWRAPRLRASDDSREAEPLPEEVLSDLRTFTRQVVTSGTGTALSGIPGEVHGKSGTAEYGSGDPPPTHAWFVAYRDDIAISVLVEGGSSGGSAAAPLAANFFNSLDG